MEATVFIISAVIVLTGAGGVVLRNNPVHCALSLVQTLFGVAVLFIAQDAQFLAAVQVIVYAGAIVVLFLFVIMLLNVQTEGRALSSGLLVGAVMSQRPEPAFTHLLAERARLPCAHSRCSAGIRQFGDQDNAHFRLQWRFGKYGERERVQCIASQDRGGDVERNVHCRPAPPQVVVVHRRQVVVHQRKRMDQFDRHRCGVELR